MSRGDVHAIRLRAGSGHEQRGERYAVVVQADEFEALSTVLIAPTSMSARATWWRPDVEVAGTHTRVLVEQTAAVDPSRLGRRAGRLETEELWAIDDALRALLALA